jgi:hypothetical protein
MSFLPKHPIWLKRQRASPASKIRWPILSADLKQISAILQTEKTQILLELCKKNATMPVIQEKCSNDGE